MNIISKDFFSAIKAALPYIESLTCAKLELMSKLDYSIQRDWGMSIIDAIDSGDEFIVYLGRFCVMFPMKSLPVPHGC